MQTPVQLYMLFVLGCLILLKSFREILNNNYLKWLFFFLIYSWTIDIISKSISGDLHPLLGVSYNVSFFLFFPVSYLYIRTQLYKDEIKQPDLVHFLPVSLFSVACLTVYFTNGNLYFFRINTPASKLPVTSGENILLSCYLFFVYLLTGIYLYLTLVILKKKYGEVFKTREYDLQMRSYIGIGTGVIIEPPREEEKHIGSFFLTDTRVAEIDAAIKRHFEESRPFLQHGYSLRQLSDETRIPLHHLSAFINKHYKMNFNDFINEYRVAYCKEKLLNGECKHKKLEAIAGESGFNNRNTFTSAFKRVTGMNPSDFLRNMKRA
jgi:AraC-like DNA-binding protein